MKKLISLFQNIRLGKVFAAAVACTFLFFTQACSSVAATTPNPNRANSEISVPKGDGIYSTYEGGMNSFSDVDPRSKSAIDAAKRKTKVLKEQAEYNQEKQTNNIAKAANRVAKDSSKLGENIEDKVDDITGKLKDTSEDVAKGTKEGLENIKDNLTNARSSLQDTALKTADNPIESAQEAAHDAATAWNKYTREANNS
ncbi:DUF6658 family protein [Calothrix sp. 336/3]|uniref:DUF6658 family protein n=1 Tax=Calothrix sp. 336/3 TaxID=1337936 RepID=UPI0004E419FE|nr:DUF6658 family protein [Calothrix sp. 336/3]AKG22726.1 hypothetical protein IJ00_16880 [Calothrix sp. 336/3]